MNILANKLTPYVVSGLIALAGCGKSNPEYNNYDTYDYITLENGEKVRFQERGPYPFREYELEVKRADGEVVRYSDKNKDFIVDSFYSERARAHFLRSHACYSNAFDMAQSQFTNYLAIIKEEKGKRACNILQGIKVEQ